MYTMLDYEKVHNELRRYGLGTSEHLVAERKLHGIVTSLVEHGDRWMIDTIIKDVRNMNRAGFELSDPGVQFELWLLESNGYRKEAGELKSLEWSDDDAW